MSAEMPSRTGHALELFAGCGGAALGLKRAGWDHLMCIEWAPAAAKTLEAAGFPALQADVRDVDWTAWAGEVDLLWASPPCQAGSAAGRRRGSQDERNGWPWTLNAIDALRPTWFLAENVLGWLRHRRGCSRRGQGLSCVGCYWDNWLLPRLQERFAFVGTWRLNAADYGVPQRRRRVIVWAGPLPLSEHSPSPSHTAPSNEKALRSGRLPWRTLADAIGDTLLDPRTCTRRHCYPCDGGFGAACKEPWRLDLPAPTVMTTEVKGTRAHAPAWAPRGGPDRASDAAFLVTGVRRIDVAEGLVLQGFPADWPIQGTIEERYRQVGNAVPPPMAEAVGRTIARVVEAVARLQPDVPVGDLADAMQRLRRTMPK
jgi:DNA (cytosine-5)-methyltransferase 1